MAGTIESDLDRRSRNLTSVYDSERFADEAAAVAELLRDHLQRMAVREGPVWPALKPEELLEHWPDPETAPQASLVSLLADFIAASTHQHHPGFVGQQLSVPPPLVGPVAMTTAIINNSSAIFQGAPVAIALERRLVTWMNQKVGFDPRAGGALTSGGSLGGLTALLAMRQAKSSVDAWQAGLAGSEPCAVLMSAEAHYCNRRACAILGLGERAVIPVATNARFVMERAAIQAAHEKACALGFRSVALVANAGSTATGSYDDLEACAAFCREHNLWLHVDAAHGGSALLSAKYRALLRGIEQADSVVWDAHKMMLMPNMCTAVLFRDAAHLDQTFQQQASYLFSNDGPQWFEPAARNFEATKPSMALPLYVALRTLGTAFLAEHLDYAYDLARAFAEVVQQRDDFELLLPPESNIVCFRLRTNQDLSDTLQLRAREVVNTRGRFFIMRTSLRGAIWLRIVLMNPATRLADLRELLAELAGAAA